MHIILVSDRLTTAKSITLGRRHVLLFATLFVSLVLLTSTAFSYFTVRHAASWSLPFAQELLAPTQAAERQRNKEYLRENLNAMAMRLGKMQAQLTRLDLMGERLAAMAGMKLPEAALPGAAHAAVPPASVAEPMDGRGGPLVQAGPWTQEEIGTALENLAHEVEERNDWLSLLESQFAERRALASHLPTSLPIAAHWSSNFGFRIDPFTGSKALHEGVDFSAAIGTSIKAAASGVVVRSEMHHEYGNLIEIDHGQQITTRYAHMSRRLAGLGSLVRRGQVIGEVGTSGRSTGAHLHFEVRKNDRALNPQRFLQAANAHPALSSLVRR